jgi:anti-sigma factor (TIGR02949 family)
MTMADGCLEVLDELERYLDGECPSQVAEVISRHLADCSPCLSRSDFERSLRSLVARYCRDEAPPGLLDRVLEQLR